MLSVWFSSQSWFNRAPPKVCSAGPMAAFEMFHCTVHCRSRDTIAALCRDAEQSRVLCFPDKANPESSGDLRREGTPCWVLRRQTQYPNPWGSEVRRSGRHFLGKLPTEALVKVTI